MVEIEAESPLCKWGRGRGVICEEKMFDAVLRFLKKSANVQNDGRNTVRPKIFSTLERRHAQTPGTGLFPTDLRV